MFPGQNGRARWAADRIGTERIQEDGALFRNSINVWGRCDVCQGTTVGGDGFDGMIVRKNEQDIRPVLSICLGCEAQRHQAEQEERSVGCCCGLHFESQFRANNAGYLIIRNNKIVNVLEAEATKQPV